MNRYMIEGIARDLEDGKDVIVVDFEYSNSDTTARVNSRIPAREPRMVSRRTIRMSNGGFLQLISSSPGRLEGRRFDVALVNRAVLRSPEGEHLGRTLRHSAVLGRGPGKPSEVIEF